MCARAFSGPIPWVLARARALSYDFFVFCICCFSFIVVVFFTLFLVNCELWKGELRAHSVQRYKTKIPIIIIIHNTKNEWTQSRKERTARKICASNAYAGSSAKSIFSFVRFVHSLIRMQAEYSSVGCYYYYWSAVAAACFFTQKSYILYKSIHKFSREEEKKLRKIICIQ